MREVYSPRSLYNIEFDKIKRSIIVCYPDSEDYGSVIVIRLQGNNNSLYVSKDGTIQILCNGCVEAMNEARETIDNIMAIFENQINDFCYNKACSIGSKKVSVM